MMHTSSRTKMAIASAMAVCFVEAAFTAQPVGAPAHAAAQSERDKAVALVDQRGYALLPRFHRELHIVRS